jgi:hypothetical protein
VCLATTGFVYPTLPSPRRFPEALRPERPLPYSSSKARPVGSVEKLWRFFKRKPALSSLTAVALLLLLVVAIGSPITAWRIRKSQLTLAENLYVADMKLVQLALLEGNWGRARSILQSYVPAQGSKDLRGFEWNYFKELAKGDQLKTVPAHSNIASVIAFTPDGGPSSPPALMVESNSGNIPPCAWQRPQARFPNGW